MLVSGIDLVKSIDVVLSILICVVYDDFPLAIVGWRWQTSPSPPKIEPSCR